MGSAMLREEMLNQLEDGVWDVLIIGGGATGLGCAVDAASRGYRTLLLDQADFAAGTSSKSTKLIHGGLRYLKQGKLSIVHDSLRERSNLLRNAPHQVHTLPFIIPCYRWWERPFYHLGLQCYGMLGGHSHVQSCRALSVKEMEEYLPTLCRDNLQGGMLYFDGQFDDARLAICLAQTAHDHHAILLNYMPVTSLLKEEDRICGAVAKDSESGIEYSIRAKVVVNATGVFADRINQMDEPHAPPMIIPSRGSHIVVKNTFLSNKNALMIPKTADGRVLFIIPWHNCLIIGTTDLPSLETTMEPRPSEEEISFLLNHAAHYLSPAPKKEDILSVFSGLRPLIRSRKGKNTAAISRDHSITLSDSGLLTIASGKWTTYRKMAEELIDRAIQVGKLSSAPCSTQNLKLHGWTDEEVPAAALRSYGSDIKGVEKLMEKSPELSQPLHHDLPYCCAELVWAVRHEMARTVEDLLARRTRSLFLNAKASIAVAPQVARLLADELGKDREWIERQCKHYLTYAQKFLPF